MGLIVTETGEREKVLEYYGGKPDRAQFYKAGAREKKNNSG